MNAPTRPAKETLTDTLKRRKPHFLRKRTYAKAFRDAGHTRIADQLDLCQEYETLACCSHCGGHWYVKIKCRLKVCPLCSFQKSLERANYLKAITAGMLYPKMITLTMPRWEGNGKNGIQFIRTAFTKLRRTALFKDVRGGAYQIEVKIKPDGFHIHIHALIDAPFIPYQKLFTAWRTILGLQHVEVNVIAATADNVKEYVCKYAAKAADFEHNKDKIVQWYVATKGQRLFATFGEWYNFKPDEQDDKVTLNDPAPTCPFCHQKHTMFFARDGPYIYGGRAWPRIEPSFTHGLDLQRPIQELRAILDEKAKESEQLQQRLAI